MLMVVAERNTALSRMQARRNDHCPSGCGPSYQLLICLGLISVRRSPSNAGMKWAMSRYRLRLVPPAIRSPLGSVYSTAHCSTYSLNIIWLARSRLMRSRG